MYANPPLVFLDGALWVGDVWVDGVLRARAGVGAVLGWGAGGIVAGLGWDGAPLRGEGEIS